MLSASDRPGRNTYRNTVFDDCSASRDRACRNLMTEGNVIEQHHSISSDPHRLVRVEKGHDVVIGMNFECDSCHVTKEGPRQRRLKLGPASAGIYL